MRSARSGTVARWAAIAAVGAALGASAARATAPLGDPPPDPGWTGPAVEHCRVPSVRGVRLAIAKRKIRRARCGVGSVKHRRARMKKGRVLMTAPRAKTILAPGTKVLLVVSRGRR